MTEKMLLRKAAFASCALLAFFALTINSEATVTVTNLSPSFGTVGTTVTIYGTNFGTTTGSVSFYNGKTATVSTWSTTAITVTVPTGATTGLMTVTPYHESGVQSTVDFNVLAADTALVLGAFPPQFSDCALLPQPGNDCITQYQNDVLTNIDGIVIQAQWSSVDLGNSAGTGPGCTSGASSATCDWSALDSLVTTYTLGSNQKVGIVLSPVTNGTTTSQINTSTPAYVFTSTWATTAGGSGTAPLYECNCKDYQGDSGVPYPISTYPNGSCWNNSTSSDTSAMPVVYEAPFEVALQDFYKAAVAHFNSSSNASYSANIAYIRMGLSTGGEEYPHCSSTMETYFSISASTLETDWTNYADAMFTYESGLGSQHPLMAAPNGNGTSTGVPSDAWADTEAHDALNEGLTLGSEGLQFQDTIHVDTGLACSNDWCNTFTFTPVSPILELQTLLQSDPSENTCGSNTSQGGDYTDTGSLVCLLPFVAGKANSVELYPQDVFMAFDSNDVNYSMYSAAYATAISNLR
jgi:hypothetical protein